MCSFSDFLNSNAERNKNLASCYVWWIIGLRAKIGSKVFFLSSSMMLLLLLKQIFRLFTRRVKFLIACQLLSGEGEASLSVTPKLQVLYYFNAPTNNNNSSKFSSSSRSRYLKYRHIHFKQQSVKRKIREQQTLVDFLFIKTVHNILLSDKLKQTALPLVGVEKCKWNIVSHFSLFWCTTSPVIPHQFFMCLTFLVFYDPKRQAHSNFSFTSSQMKRLRRPFYVLHFLLAT